MINVWFYSYFKKYLLKEIFGIFFLFFREIKVVIVKK